MAKTYRRMEKNNFSRITILPSRRCRYSDALFDTE